MMSKPFLTFLYRFLRADVWMNLAITLGVAVACAVLTGSILVGDSMRGSLRNLTLQRLGRIDSCLTSDGFFSETMLDTDRSGNRNYSEVHTIVLTGAAQKNESQSNSRNNSQNDQPDMSVPRSAGTQIVGCDDEFWQLWRTDDPPSQWQRNEVAINRTLANQLGVTQEGETILLRFAKPELVPQESSLGRSADTLIRARVTVRQILNHSGLGRFSMTATQQVQPLVVTPLSYLQSPNRLDCENKINTVFFTVESPQLFFRPQDPLWLESILPSPADLGILLNSYGKFTHIQSRRLIFTDPQAAAIEQAIRSPIPNIAPDFTEICVYLADSLRIVKQEGNGGVGNDVDDVRDDGSVVRRDEVPYSLVAAMDTQWLEDKTVLRNGEIILNTWTAAELGATVGDTIELSYFAPESSYGNQTLQKTSLRLAAVCDMTGLAADPHLVPEIKGVSDSAALANWNPPFPFDSKRIKPQDETYWDDHKTTPKAFVSLETGKKLWQSRFGTTTGFVSRQSLNDLTSNLRRIDRELFGFRYIPLKKQGIAASIGTTPFQVLFAMFGFFIIAAAMMLIAMLFRLAIERKARHLGILLAVGWPPKQVYRFVLLQGGVIAAVGTIVGVFAGIFFAMAMLSALKTVWIGAITTPFLQFHWTFFSLFTGAILSFAMSMAVVWFSTKTLTKKTARTLLNGNVFMDTTERMYSDTTNGDKLAAGNLLVKTTRSDRFLMRPIQTGHFDGVPSPFPATMKTHNVPPLIIYGGLLAATLLLIVVMFATPLMFRDPMTRAAVQFCTGMVVLGVLLLGVRHQFRWRVFPIRHLNHLMYTGVMRNSTRSTLCVGLVATTLFFVLAVSAFHLTVSHSGKSGGKHVGLVQPVQVVMESQLPFFANIMSSEGHDELAMTPAESAMMTRLVVHHTAIRVRSGDDASCQNLYPPTSPKILGIPHSAFADGWLSGFEHEPSPFVKDTHTTITRDGDGVWRVPVVLDGNTAMYSMHLYGGVGETFEVPDGYGGVVRCEIVKLLQNSMWQGVILMEESHFTTLFPDTPGYRMFVFQQAIQQAGITTDETAKTASDLPLSTLLAGVMADFGVTIETVPDRLSRFYLIQNTYIATFQSLGLLGLLLGILGIGIVQWRNVLERQKEIAMFKVVGFTNRRMFHLILGETVGLLSCGLIVAMVSTFVAVPGRFFSAGLFGTTLLTLVALSGVGLISAVIALRAVSNIPLRAAMTSE